MSLTFESAVSAYGASAKSKLSNPAVSGEPEDQLRGPLATLIEDLAVLSGRVRSDISVVGETAIKELKTRPDFAVTVGGALVGFVEVKSPGKGANPARYRDHDKAQWEKLRSLPNLVYTDGNEFSLWRSGERAGATVVMSGDVATSGTKLEVGAELEQLFQNFLSWEPIAPRGAKALAEVSARLCRLLRDETAEQIEAKNPALTALAVDWKKWFFPDAKATEFADGYAQAVTFGMLMARAKGIRLSDGLHQAGTRLGQTNTLIGTALRLLTDHAENQRVLKTSVEVIKRVLDAVDWATVTAGEADAWLYFYEDFLEVYDKVLRKKTGSYYTPPQVVDSMVRLVDDALRLRFTEPAGLSSSNVRIADPAVGTGTFVLGILRRIAGETAADEGEGAVAGVVRAAAGVDQAFDPDVEDPPALPGRITSFELQLGPFAVAQLRIMAELSALTGHESEAPARMFITNTLASPYVEEEYLGSFAAPIARSRKMANRIKRQEPITVVIGNPPYKEKAKGLGGWVESGAKNDPKGAPLLAWIPPRDWGVSAHAKHLRNLYVYFWRWATWKVFDHHPEAGTGIVCFITVAGFLNGPGFQKMRDDLRRKADDIWVVDCTPEGHQPDVPTRIFQGVQQPVCIVMASRSAASDLDVPARVRFHALPKGPREEKFAALARLKLDSEDWVDGPTGWRDPFLPASVGAWATFPHLEDFFLDSGSGVMPGRTWVIAPDSASLLRRWAALINAPSEKKEALFHPHLRKEGLGDKHSKKVVTKSLAGQEARFVSVADDRGDCLTPVRYGFRSFDRQWIIPDSRLINQPNPDLWERHSGHQVYLTALTKYSPTSGPAMSFTGSIPDLDHYKGSFGGRAFPLWSDAGSTLPNIPAGLLNGLSQRYDVEVKGPDIMAYIAAIAAHPGYVDRFKEDLVQPGLRIPLTAEANLFAEAASIGRRLIWLHTFGERFADPAEGRPAQAPRLPKGAAPRIPVEGAIPGDADSISYDAAKGRLLVGSGFVEGVTPAMWGYEVSGKRVLTQWFSYRKKDRERPLIGERRPPSKLGDIQPEGWLAEYTTELLNVLHVLGLLVELEPAQADLLTRICDGPTIPSTDLPPREPAAASPVPRPNRKKDAKGQGSLLD